MKKILLKIWSYIEVGAQESEYTYVVLGYLFLFGYAGWYIIWHKVSIQAYESLNLRILCSALGIPLIIKNYWPEFLKKFMPIYWYIAILVAIPFFFTFMLLKNNGSVVWQLNCISAIVLLILITDWMSVLILCFLGVSTALIAYKITTTNPLLPVNTIAIILNTLSVILFCGFFLYKKTKAHQEKVDSMRALSASIAHELRTPLRTILMSVNSIKHKLGAVKKNKIADTAAFMQAFENIDAETKASFSIVEMLLTKLDDSKITSKDHTRLNMSKIIATAIERYPYDIGENEKIIWQKKNDFEFIGNEVLMTHLVFNLMKNAFYQIKKAGKGNIEIWTENFTNENVLHVKDYATGIPKRKLNKIFERFYSETRHGSGVGLTFCKLVMQNLGGSIEVFSKDGEYAEFVMHFPKIHK